MDTPSPAATSNSLDSGVDRPAEDEAKENEENVDELVVTSIKKKKGKRLKNIPIESVTEGRSEGDEKTPVRETLPESVRESLITSSTDSGLSSSASGKGEVSSAADIATAGDQEGARTRGVPGRTALLPLCADF